MFSQNKEETKLDWMYKGANSLVDRDEYLLGRSIDKSLEQLNAEEKQKASNQLPPPKNHVEHECIPPSIRDYNKISLADQVDLAAKLQEDPLVAIRKREEETRKQFLQNPIQLKKLQKALTKQQSKKKKKKEKKSKRSKDIDEKLMEKLQQLKSNPLGMDLEVPGQKGDKDSGIDNILIHKFNKMKDKLSEGDIRAILEGKETSSDEDSGGKEERSTIKRLKHKKEQRSESSSKKRRDSSSDSERDDRKRKVNSKSKRKEQQKFAKASLSKKSATRSSSGSDSESDSDSDVAAERSRGKKNWGLVTHTGKKIELKKQDYAKPAAVTSKKEIAATSKPSRVRLSEEEKERRRREMMQNAAWRDKERERNVKKYREEDRKESKQHEYSADFIHKQMLKATAGSSVESRIKSNLNNIQRSASHMDKNFSRRH